MYWIHPDFPDASQSFSNCLASMLRQYNKKNRPLVFVCIGTPSILGDCLGPVIGSILSVVPTSGAPVPADIYGTLDAPVHALNFQDTCREIKKRHQKPFIIAIDAALGNSTQSGYVLLKKGPLHPGKGVGNRSSADYWCLPGYFCSGSRPSNGPFQPLHQSGYLKALPCPPMPEAK